MHSRPDLSERLIDRANRDIGRKLTEIKALGLGHLETYGIEKVKLKIISTGTNDMGYDGIVGARALFASRFASTSGK